MLKIRSSLGFAQWYYRFLRSDTSWQTGVDFVEAEAPSAGVAAAALLSSSVDTIDALRQAGYDACVRVIANRSHRIDYLRSVFANPEAASRAPADIQRPRGRPWNFSLPFKTTAGSATSQLAGADCAPFVADAKCDNKCVTAVTISVPEEQFGAYTSPQLLQRVESSTRTMGLARLVQAVQWRLAPPPTSAGQGETTSGAATGQQPHGELRFELPWAFRHWACVLLRLPLRGSDFAAVSIDRTF